MSVWMVLAITAPIVLAVVFAWVLYHVVRQQGRLLVGFEELRVRVARLEAVTERMGEGTPLPAAQQPGLLPGTPVPHFSLPDLDGRPRSPSDYKGKPSLMVFFDPACGFCEQLAPRLRDLPRGPRQLVIMSRGDRAANQRLALQNEWRADVLVEPAWDVAATIGVNATPTGYLIDAEGHIASPLAMGVDAVLGLVSAQSNHDHPALTAESLRVRSEVVAQNAKAAGLGITESRLTRDGLPAGSRAPNFTREDLEGKPRSLADSTGKYVLLVFSDPTCGPCQQLAPHLEQLHRAHRSSGLDVLMVSRGDVETNRQKLKEHELTFPVVLQDAWEISREYGIFATPVGYLIDERGVIAKDVAVGADAILSLVST